MVNIEIDGVKDEIRRQTGEGERIYQQIQQSPTQAHGSPGKGSPGRENTDNVWFDIEKSQERYEAILDSYQKIIKDKDIY